METEADSVLCQSTPVHAIYFGGSTPSALSVHGLARVTTTLREKLSLAPDCEITIEDRVLNPDAKRIDACLDAGAGRFSIDIQLLNSKIRKKMIRTSDGLTAIVFMESLVKRDRTAVVCDLLFGLPGQDAQTQGGDPAITHDIGLDGVDLYALNVLPNTPLGKAAENGRTTVPSPAKRRDLYLQGCDFMNDAGWYCISNGYWGHTTRGRNPRNLLIKQGANCLAFGSGAGGSASGYFWMNERSFQTRCESVTADRKPPTMIMHNVEHNAQWRHTLQSGIEAARVPPDELTPRAEKLAPLLAQWHQKGLSRDTSTCLWLTNEDRSWASNILQFLSELAQVLNAPTVAFEKP